MISELQAFYLNKEEPVKSCLMAMRDYILKYSPDMTETWTHKMPMFKYRGKLFCYLWVNKKTYEPYIGIYKGIEIDHPKLDLGNRNKMKIMEINPNEDLPIDTLNEIFELAIPLYSGKKVVGKKG
ncbi:MAG TPA: DUF1801 domain-containing protein [Bacteroidetes bacterium]|nr:DUF1801 domain-containing protein [Bacteroidota bacterium]